MVHPIVQSLRRRGVRHVCHMTPCDRLPSIFQHRGLLSRWERQHCGIADPPDDAGHFWGSPDKQDALAGFVICSFMAPWWMCKKRDEELAIIVLDAEQICLTGGACFCPVNSAFNEYPAATIQTLTGIDAFDACFQNPDTYQAGSAEVFVPNLVPLSAFRGIVFCDVEAKSHWVPQLREALGSLPDSSFPSQPIGVGERRWMGFSFPGNYAAARRIRP